MSTGKKILFLFLCHAFSLACLAGNTGKTDEPYANSNLLFVENKSQWEGFIRYKADLKGGKLFLENNRFTYAFYSQDDVARLHPGHGAAPENIRMHAIRVTLAGSSTSNVAEPGQEASYRHNYFIGSDASKWATDVKLYKQVLYKNIYAGIDLNFYSDRSNLKYDFIVKPGSSVSSIALVYEGADAMELEEGNLKISTSVGDLVEQRPYAYQVVNGEKVEVPCSFRLNERTVRFYFPEGYNKRLPLVIDPTLVFSSYTGSLADNWGFTATYDGAGNAYSGGNVNTFGYPVTPGAYQLAYGGSGTSGNGWGCDMAIAKFNASGTSLLYATYLGGSNNEQPQSLIVDTDNNLFIYGVAYSANFPVTSGAYSTTKNSGGDMVVCKLSPNGNILLGSTFIGGTRDDGVNTAAGLSSGGPIKYNYGDDARGEIVLDGAGNCVIASCTRSFDFPVTAGAYQPTFAGGGQDGVLFKLNASLTALQWATYLGGSNMDAVYSCVFDGAGNIYATGGTASTNFPATAGTLHPSFVGGSADGFIAHLSADGSSMLHSTFIGTNEYDQTFFVQLDASGDIFTTGQTEGNYPVSAGVYSNPGSAQFIHKLSPDLGTSIFSTVFGNGSSIPNMSPTAFLVDTCGNIYVSGWGRCISIGGGQVTTVSGMPVTAGALQTTTNGCDFYFIILSRDALTLEYGSFFGGNASEEHVDGGTSRFDPNGVIYQSVCAGCGGNSDLPTTPGVVSNTNQSNNCNNAVIKIQFNFSKTRARATANPTLGCSPLLVHFTNTSINGVTYTWDFDDGSPRSNSFEPTHTFTLAGTHQVMLISRNSQSCNIADTVYIPVIVTVAPPVVASMNLQPAPTCDSMSLQATYTGVGGNLFRWNFGDGGTAIGLTAHHTYVNAGTYVVTLVARDTICLLSDSVDEPVRFRPNIDAQISNGGVLFGCAPQTLTFQSLQATAAGIAWNFGDNTTATGNTVAHTFSGVGHYSIQLIVSDTGSCNQADTAVFSLDVYPMPRAGFFHDVQKPFYPSIPITFTDTSANGNSVLWDFGDGSFAVDSVVKHAYRRGGSFDVCLTATSQEGCVDSLCRSIEIESAEGIYVPNSFTPNHDGNNDYFFPVTMGILEMKVRIFNRWGKLINQWEGLEGHWDGRTGGDEAQQDVYLYQIDAVGSITPVIQKIGRVTLVH